MKGCPCSAYPDRDECGSFRPTLAMAEQEIGYGTLAGEALVLDNGTSHDSGTGELE